jgi:hypothetical protein
MFHPGAGSSAGGVDDGVFIIYAMLKFCTGEDIQS